MKLAAREVLSFPPSNRAPALARRAVRDFALAAGSPEAAERAELLASELVTNAVRHGRGTVTVLMESSAAGLSITVSDDEPREPVMPASETLSVGGRGLHLVEALASTWGVTANNGRPGKGVWFVLA